MSMCTSAREYNCGVPLSDKRSKSLLFTNNISFFFFLQPTSPEWKTNTFYLCATALSFSTETLWYFLQSWKLIFVFLAVCWVCVLFCVTKKKPRIFFYFILLFSLIRCPISTCMIAYWCWQTPSIGSLRTGSGTVWPALTAWGSLPSHGMEDGLCWTLFKRYLGLKSLLLFVWFWLVFNIDTAVSF